MNRKSLRRRALALATAATAIVSASPTLAATTASWVNPVSGNWTDATKWSTNPNYPNNGTPAGTTYDVVVAATGAPYIVSLSAALTLSGLSIASADASVNHTSGTVDFGGTTLAVAAGSFHLSGGTISNASIMTSGSGAFGIVGASRLETVTLDADVFATASAQLLGNLGIASGRTYTFANNAHFIAGETIIDDVGGGGAQIVFGGTDDSASITQNTVEQLTIASGMTVRTGTGGGTVGGSLLFRDQGRFINLGTLTAETPGRTLTIAGEWTNSGNIQLSAGTLALGGRFTTADIGTISRTGGSIRITGAMNNTGATLAISDLTGTITLAPQASITGGTITTAGSAQFISAGGELKGVSMNTDWTALSPASTAVRVRDNSVLSGHLISVGDNTVRGLLTLIGSQSLGADVEVVFNGLTSGSLSAESALVIAPDSIVRTGTGSGSISGGGGSQNNGLVSGETPGHGINVSALTNNATIQAINGGNITFSGSVNSATGTINATAGSTLAFAGNWSNAGTITTADATVNLGGSFTTAAMGTFNRTGGFVNVTGSLDNTGNTITMTPSIGAWTLMPGGSIKSGTISSTGGASLSITGGTLNAVTLAAEATVASGTSFTLAGPIPFGPNGKLTFNGTASGPFTTATYSGSFSGTGEIVFDNGTSVINTLGDGALLFGSNVVVRTGTGSGRLTVPTSWQGLENSGTISAQTNGQSILVSAAKIRNFGTFEARNGGTLTISGPLDGFSAGALGGGWWSVYAGSELQHSNPITHNFAKVILSGPGSVFAAFDSLQNNAGTINLEAGRQFTTSGPFTHAAAGFNPGSLNVAAGSTFTVAGLLTWTGGPIGGEGAVIATGGATITGTVTQSGPGVLHVQGPFSLASNRRLSMTTGKLLLAGDNVSTWDGGAYTGVSGLVQTGRNGGEWNGTTGIRVADNRARDGDLVSIGVATAADVRGIADTASTTFAGQTLLGSDTIVMVTWGGDANLDGQINIDDYGRIDANVSQSGSVFGYANGDFNYDGSINIDDYGIIDSNITRQGEPFPTSIALATERVGSVSAVPEPAALALLMFAPLLLPRRRRAIVRR